MTRKDLNNNENDLPGILNSAKLVIYGAGSMGKSVCRCLTEAPFNLSIECFIVKSQAGNDSEIYGLPVIDIAHASEYMDATILIALNGKYIPEVIGNLKEGGFSDLIPISFDGDLWTTIRKSWIRENCVLPKDILYLSDFKDKKVDCFLVENAPDKQIRNCFHIYVAHSIYDKKIADDVKKKSYEIDIQVGAALTDKEIFDIRDNIGKDNISEKNKQYCELTGMYWAWKNDNSDYVGFSHYRRRFVLDDDQMKSIITNEIDIVVTEPLLNFTTVKGQYEKDHVAEDWGIFTEVISEVAPEYLTAIQRVENGIYYFAYNMFIMKKDIFGAYCSILFPILDECQRRIGEKEDTYQNRYVGFLAERFLLAFIIMNPKYKVAIADKTFVE